MSTRGRFGQNLAANYAAQVSVKLLAFVWLLAVANRLGAAEYGKLATAISIVSILGVWIDFGIINLVTREVARDRGLALSFAARAVGLKIVLSVVFTLLMAGIVRLMGYPADTTVIVYALTGFVILRNFAAIPRSIYYAYERITLSSLFALISKIVSVAAGFAVLYGGGGLIAVACCMALEGLVELVLGATFLPRLVDRDHQASIRESGLTTLRRSFPLAFVSVMVVFHVSMDTVLLSKMGGALEVAWYTAAFRLVAALTFLPETFASTIYPLLCRRQSEDRPLRDWLDPAFRFLFVGGLFIGTVFFFSPGLVVSALYPAEFAEAIPVLRIMGAVAVLLFVNELLGSALNATNRESARSRITFAAFLVDVTACLLLIPRYAHIGAAVATLSTHLTVTLGYLLYLRRGSAFRPAPSFFGKVAVALIAAGISSVLLSRLHAAAGLVAAPLAFAGSCLGLGIFHMADYRLASGLLRDWRRTPRATQGRSERDIAT